VREVEVKILDVDSEELQKKLVELGAEKTFEGIVRAEFYDFEGKTLKADGRRLRLRTLGDKPVLTYKKNIKEEKAKVREEYEVEVSNLEDMKKILVGVGMNVIRETEKTRISYKLDDVIFEIDTYHGRLENIPTFLEIENEHIERIHELAGKLGFTEGQCTNYTLTDLVEHYK